LLSCPASGRPLHLEGEAADPLCDAYGPNVLELRQGQLLRTTLLERLSGNCAGNLMFAYALLYAEQEIPHGSVR
jgi:hypothetical protein